MVGMVAGPGTGKSTTAAGVFFELKQRGVNCELVGEYAKDVVWGRTTVTLGNQIYIFGKQYHRLWRLMGQVDVIVTDAPIIMSLYYGGKMGDTFKKLVLQTHHDMENMTYFLERVKEYNPAGRMQTEDEAREVDGVLRGLLDEHGIAYTPVRADRHAPDVIADEVVYRLCMT